MTIRINSLSIYVLMLIICFSTGCKREQYNGDHISEDKQKTLTDEHNNYHVRETKRVLSETEKRNDKKEKQDHKKRKDLLKFHLSLKGNKSKKKRSLKFDYY